LVFRSKQSDNKTIIFYYWKGYDYKKWKIISSSIETKKIVPRSLEHISKWACDGNGYFDADNNFRSGDTLTLGYATKNWRDMFLAVPSIDTPQSVDGFIYPMGSSDNAMFCTKQHSKYQIKARLIYSQEDEQDNTERFFPSEAIRERPIF